MSSRIVSGAPRGFARLSQFGQFVLGLLCLVWIGVMTLPAHADDALLDPSAAFQFSSEEAPGQVVLHFLVAPGYHLYRERFAFAAAQSGATLGAPQMPPGVMLYDEAFSKNLEVYRGGMLTIRLPVTHAAGPFDLNVTSQGCADMGVCYPPAVHVVHVSAAALSTAPAQGGQTTPAVAALAAVASSTAASDIAAQAIATSEPQAGHPVQTAGDRSAQPESALDATTQGPWYERVTSAGYAQTLLEGSGFFSIVALYFVAGMVLSLLPCSYPMIPILSAIIVGGGHTVTRARGLSLSAAYVLGMALVYTVLGIVAASVGQALGAWLQNPWVLGVFAVLLAAFAVTLIAGMDIALPQRWQDGAARVSSARSGGHYAAVAAMGALSALVVGACMTAPLFAVLTFIAHTGNLWLGGAALFAMGAGLGVPLLIVGLGAGTLLPRAGAWMDGVKVFFGVALLAAALWIVWPALGNAARMILCALWLLVAAVMLGLFAPRQPGIVQRFRRMAGLVCAVWAVTLIVGLAAGSSDPLRPLAVFAHGPEAGAGATAAANGGTHAGPVFAPVRTSAELDQIVRGANGPVLLDFYADWCVSCKEMEHLTFSNTRVAARLAQMHLVRADVTANNADDQALLKRFGLFGPPGIIVFVNGREAGRVVGYQAPDAFLRSLDQAQTHSTGA